jgi:hypothetical protein
MDRVREYTATARGHASAEAHRREAEAALARVREQIKAATRRMLLPPGSDEEAEAVAVIRELEHVRHEAQAAVDRLGPGGRRKTVGPDVIARLPAAKRLVEWRGLITEYGRVGHGRSGRTAPAAWRPCRRH